MTKPQHTQPPGPVAHAPQPVRPRDPDKPFDMPDALGELIEWCEVLDKAVAGYNALNGALQSHQKAVPAGERLQGLPLFEHKTPSMRRHGTTVFTQVIDLKKCDPAFVGHVLIPLINYYISQVQEAYAEITNRVARIDPLLKQMVGEPCDPKV